jgi:hypothetical protein
MMNNQSYYSKYFPGLPPEDAKKEAAKTVNEYAQL